MASPADPSLEATLRAEMDVLMKRKETLKNIIRDDVGKKEKLKEEYAKVMSDLADLGRRLITLKKDTAMTPKLVTKTLPTDASSASSPTKEVLPDLPSSSSVSPHEEKKTFPSAPETKTPLAPDDDAPPPAPDEADLPPPPPEDDMETSIVAPPGNDSDADEPPDAPPPDLEEEPEWLRGIDLTKAISPEMTQHIFERFDADKNGYLDKQEAALFLTEWCGQHGVTDVEKVKTEFWKRFDADGDGQITKVELLNAFRPVTKKPVTAEERERAFKTKLLRASVDWTALKGTVSATGDANTIQEGYLLKKGAADKAFKRRYCVLTRDQLLYYENLETKQLKGKVVISPESTSAPLANFGFWICPAPGSRQYEFTAEDALDQTTWLGAIASLGKTQSFHGSTHEGWLVKKGEQRKNWTRRFFVLHNHKLLFFENLETKKLSGEMLLSYASAVWKSEDAKTAFWIFPGGEQRVYECEAVDAHTRNTWVNVLDKYIYSQILLQSVDPKRPEGVAKGTIIIKVFRISNLTNIKGLLSTGGSSRLVGKLPGLYVTLKVGTQLLKTRTYDSGYRAVFNQVFIIPKSQWAQGTDLVCEVTDQGSARSKSLGTINFVWPEEKKGGFYKGGFSFVDKSGQSGGQLEVAVIDADVLADGMQMQTVLSPEVLTGIDQYLMGKQLGKGGCGTVYLAKHKLTNNSVAIKVVAKEKEFEVRTEMDVMQMLKHPHCVKLEEMIEMKTNIYMVMELMGDDLQHRIYEKYNGTVPEDVCRVWMKEMALALEYCHEIGVVHRDIKPENLMFGSDGSALKLTDFGLSTFKQAVMSESCGTPPFMAPELVTQKPYGKEVDMWALGVTLFQTVSGTMPFDQNTQDLTFIAIKRASYTVRPEWRLSPELVHLFKCLFEIDPKVRLTASQMLDHPWIKGEPLGDYVVPRKEVYEALKEAQKPSSPAPDQSMRRRLVKQGSEN